MSRRDAYRAFAADCMKLAAVVHDATTKLVFLNMAQAWLRLSDHVDLGRSYQVEGVFGADGAQGPSPQLDPGPDHDREA
ncbi:MAG TPA: hypothetical protein VIY51_15165 [Xanthobacteraceae bacterium]